MTDPSTSTEPADADGDSAEELFVRMQALPAGSAAREAVRDRLVEANLPLVHYLARRFGGRREPMDDLVQVGAIGLIKAIDRFDPSRGIQFASFATPTIVGEIKRHFRDTGWALHVPRRAQELQARLRAAREDLSQEYGRAPTVPELAQRLDTDESAVIEALDVAQAYATTPLDSLAAPGESVPEHPALREIDEGFEQVEQRMILRELISELPPDERETLLLRFFAQKTQTEIAAVMGVSQMQISRLVNRGLTTLRERAAQRLPPQASPNS